MIELDVADIIAIRTLDASQAEFGFVYDIHDDAVQILELRIIKNKLPENSGATPLADSDIQGGRLPEGAAVLINRMTLIAKGSVIRKLGRVGVEKIDEIYRKLSHRIASKHYSCVHSRRNRITPGTDYIAYAGRVYDENDMIALMDSCLDFWLTEGRFAERFKTALADHIGARHCILTNSGSSANLLAVSALTSPRLGNRRLKPGDEVITVAACFPTTVAPLVQNDLVPVFVDIEPGTYNIDASKIEEALTEKTRALILAHTLGNPFDLGKIMKLVDRYDLWLIEDNCDALGSLYEGKHTGTFGHIGTMSFYPPHHITTGEGGALTTHDATLKKIIESFRGWGRDCWCGPGKDNSCSNRFNRQFGGLPFGYDHKYVYSHLGYNLKMSEMQAAVGTSQIEKLAAFVQRRVANFNFLYRNFMRFADFFVLPETVHGAEPAWFGFPLTVKDGAPFTRNEIVTYLENRKIGSRMLFAGNMVRQPAMEGAPFRAHSLKNTDRVMNNGFWLGVYPGLTLDMLDYVVKQVEAFIAERAARRSPAPGEKQVALSPCLN